MSETNRFLKRVVGVDVETGGPDTGGLCRLLRNCIALLTHWLSMALSIHRLYRINKFAGSEYLTLDLLEADSSSNAILVDRETFDIEGRSVQALSKNALIKMKLDSNRTKDRLDVELLSDQAN